MYTLLTAAGAEMAKRATKPIQGRVYTKLYNLILDGHLPAERIGGRLAIDLEEAAKALGVELKEAA